MMMINAIQNIVAYNVRCLCIWTDR